jgi:DNA-binding PadR family transcriptional regulator
MHGYMIMTQIRRSFGICVGASSVYPVLTTLEESGYVESEWKISNQRPKKVYSLTIAGRRFLNFIEDSLRLICKNLTINGKVDVVTEITQNEISPAARVTLYELSRRHIGR